MSVKDALNQAYVDLILRSYKEISKWDDRFELFEGDQLLGDISKLVVEFFE